MSTFFLCKFAVIYFKKKMCDNVSVCSEQSAAERVKAKMKLQLADTGNPIVINTSFVLTF